MGADLENTKYREMIKIDIDDKEKEKSGELSEIGKIFDEKLTEINSKDFKTKDELYKIAKLKAGKEDLKDLREDNKINRISKYYLSNYGSYISDGVSLGVAMAFKDVSNKYDVESIDTDKVLVRGLITSEEEKNIKGHKIEGFIDYYSISNGKVNEMQLVVLGGKIFRIEETDGEIVLFPEPDLKFKTSFEIEEIRNKPENKENKEKFDQLDKEKVGVVDEDIEKEAKLELENELKNTLNTIITDEVIEEFVKSIDWEKEGAEGMFTEFSLLVFKKLDPYREKFGDLDSDKVVMSVINLLNKVYIKTTDLNIKGKGINELLELLEEANNE